MDKSSGLISKLASSLGRRDEEPNILLAAEIVRKNQPAAIRELVASLESRNAHIQNDCIKVLYEVGSRKPKLIAPYANTFLGLLEHKNNRLQWGGMTALASIAGENPKWTYDSIPIILKAAEKGSVITRDNAVKILISLATQKLYLSRVFPLLMEQLLGSPTNQLPMYAENILPLVGAGQKAVFIKTLQSRLPEVEQESKKRRLEKLIRKAQSL